MAGRCGRLVAGDGFRSVLRPDAAEPLHYGSAPANLRCMQPAPIPDSLREEAESVLEEIRPDLDGAVLGANRPALLNLFAASPFAARLARTCPDLLESALRDPGARELEPPDPETAEDADFARALRRARTREMLRIMFRDINGLAGLPDTLRDLSAFADRAVVGAVRWHRARMKESGPVDESGDPVPFVVLGMGKLGGEELNFSSDIDLIFAYPDPASDRERAQSYFIRLGQKTIKALDEVTADGFVFRVDMRLRPFGSTGSLALPFSSMEAYYQNHGREWERYALIKARPLGEPTAAGAELTDLLRPFVYRRSLDFQVLEELRTMKAKMEHHARRETLEDDLKHGPGGIREAEFIVQSAQLIFGGRESVLQQASWMRALGAMNQCGKLTDGDVQLLLEAYSLLRTVENRLQMIDDQQTHTLPQDPLARERLRFAMGCPDWGEFMDALAMSRVGLQLEFTCLMRVELKAEQEHPEELKTLLHVLETIGRQDDGEPVGLEEVLAKMGLEDGAQEPARRLQAIIASTAWRTQNTGGRHYALALIPKMIESACRQDAPAPVLNLLLDVLEALLYRPNYLALLTENPRALNLLAELTRRSPWVQTQILRSPDLIDELLSPTALFGERSPEILRNILQLALPADEADLEQQMKALRQFRRSQTLQVAACNLVHSKSLSDVSDELTWIAEVVTACAWDLAMRQQLERHGRPRCTVDGRRRPAHGAILAYGKFGGLEMGFSSDLDLVFVHDSDGEEQMTDGEKPVYNEYFFTRVVQRFIHIMETLTADGTLYEVDPRLRPGGQSGQTVCSLHYYEQYLEEKAWTWERQALARARVVAGEGAVRAAFGKVRARILRARREPAGLQQEFVDMRRRMLEAHAPRAGRFDIKNDPGGITDLEFMVHYNVLLHAGSHPEIIEPTATVMILDRLAQCGLLDAETAEFLRGCYFAYRDRMHVLNLQELPPHSPSEEFADERGKIRKLWDKTFDLAT